MTGIQATSVAQLTAWREGRIPAVEQTRPGLWSIPISFPDNPLRYTLCHVRQCAVGVVVIDPGYGSDENWDLLVEGLDTAGCSVEEVGAVLVTHYHLDHWGGADRLAAAAGCKVWIAEAEFDWYARRSFSEFSPTAMRGWYESLGAPAEELERIVLTDDVHQTLMHDAQLHLLSAGDAIPFTAGNLRTLATPGHTDGHLSFVDDELGVLLGGDHVLPSVSTNVALTPFGGRDPLGAFLASLQELRQYGGYEVHPAHQYRFIGLQNRIDVMIATVRRRLAFVEEIVAEDRSISAWDVAGMIPRKRRPWSEFDPLSIRLGLGEAAAYLAHLGSLDI